MELQPDTLFHGRYRLLSEKGRGSFGEVWLARDEQLDLEVAVKIYIALDDRGIEEFKSEYKTAYTLNHPNLLHAYHFDICERRPYLVMPYCPGSAVSLVGRIDERTAWRFIRDVASGLSYLHQRDTIHRDIKPDNVLQDENGVFQITDFGISMRMRSTLRRNSTRQQKGSDLSGTIGYMAPELFSKNPDAVKATDIWALGASLYEMLTGELPFMGQGGVMQLHGAEVPAVKGAYSRELKEVVTACLAADAWNRPKAGKLAKIAGGKLQIAQAPNKENRSQDKIAQNNANNMAYRIPIWWLPLFVGIPFILYLSLSILSNIWDISYSSRVIIVFWLQALTGIGLSGYLLFQKEIRANKLILISVTGIIATRIAALILALIDRFSLPSSLWGDCVYWISAFCVLTLIWKHPYSMFLKIMVIIYAVGGYLYNGINLIIISGLLFLVIIADMIKQKRAPIR